MFIIDIGSGNSLKTIDQACATVKAVKDLCIPDSYVKFQLFQKAGNNIPLDPEIFDRATKYCHVMGMPYGVSVFDEWSLDLAIHSGALKFLKLANRPDLRWLINKAPKEDRWIISTDDPNLKIDRRDTDIIYCISKYPAKEKEYEKFGDKLKRGCSDHTVGWGLFKRFSPAIYECHFVMARDDQNPDGGDFARLPSDFEEIKVKHSAEDIFNEMQKEGIKSDFNE